MANKALAADIPAVVESGLPGFESTPWWAVSGRAGMLAAIVAPLNAELNMILRTEDMRKRLAADGADPAGGSRGDRAAFV